MPSDLKRQQRGEEKRKADSSSWKFWAQGDSGSDVEKLSTDVPLKSGEKYVQRCVRWSPPSLTRFF